MKTTTPQYPYWEVWLCSLSWNTYYWMSTLIVSLYFCVLICSSLDQIWLIRAFILEIISLQSLIIFAKHSTLDVWQGSAYAIEFAPNYHCVKGVRIRSFSGPYFPAFGLNTDRYGVIQRYRKNSNTDTFHVVYGSNIFQMLFVIPQKILWGAIRRNKKWSCGLKMKSKVKKTNLRVSGCLADVSQRIGESGSTLKFFNISVKIKYS